jgi:hypothetical protein
MIGSSERTQRRLEILYFFALFGVVFFLRLPSFSDAMCDPDQGEVAYAAKLLLIGHCPYGEAIITKPPASLLLYTSLFGLFGPHMLAVHLFAALWAFATTVLLYLICKRNMGIFAGAVGAGMYAFYQAELLSSGTCPNYEYWSMFPALLSLLWSRDDKLEGRSLRMFGVGAAAGLSAMAKQTGVVFFAAALIYTFVVWVRSTRLTGWQTLVSAWLWQAAGFAAMVLAFVPVFAAVHCLGATARELNPLVLGNYLGAITRQQQWGFYGIQMNRFWHSCAALVTLVVFSLAAVLATYKTRKNLSLFAGGQIYALASAASVFSGGRFYGHYFVVVFPFACLVIALGLGSVTRTWPRWLRWSLAVPLLACVLMDSFSELRLAWFAADSLRHDRTVLSQRIFSDNRNGGFEFNTANQTINQLEWDLSFQDAARRIKPELRPGDTIWCYDYTPEMYYHLDAWAPTRHNENFDVVTVCSDPWFGSWHGEVDDVVRSHRERLMRELNARPPAFIFRHKLPCPGGIYEPRRPQTVWPINVNGQPMGYCPCKMETFAELQAFIDAHYDEMPPETNGAMQIYELRNR